MSRVGCWSNMGVGCGSMREKEEREEREEMKEK